MTLLPGRLEPDRVDDASLGLLADLLATVHEVEPSRDVRLFQSWAWEAKYVVPRWASDPGLWQDAFALLRTPVPAYEPTFLHRDFGPHNVLWSDGQVTGLVDWVETSVGPGLARRRARLDEPGAASRQRGGRHVRRCVRRADGARRPSPTST